MNRFRNAVRYAVNGPTRNLARQHVARFARFNRGRRAYINPRAMIPQAVSAGAGMAGALYNGLRLRGGADYKGGGVRKLGGRRRSFKSRKVHTIDRKPRINKKFMRKVQKVINYNEPYGKLTFVVNRQMRQDEVDKYKYYQEDQDGFLFQFGTPLDILNKHSILFNGKVLSTNVGVLTGNLQEKNKFPIKSYNVYWTFKSTSSHVVRIEMYTCTSKMDQDDSAQAQVAESYNSITSVADNAQGVTAPGLVIGSHSEDWIELHRTYNVQKRVIVLQPGDNTTAKTTVFGMKTYDMCKTLDNGALKAYPKGCKSVFFRVLNDATVSATVANIHNWNSNSIGGVAVTCTQVYKCKPTADTTEANQKPTIKIYHANDQVGTSSDQQVAFQNPIAPIAAGP